MISTVFNRSPNDYFHYILPFQSYFNRFKERRSAQCYLGRATERRKTLPHSSESPYTQLLTLLKVTLPHSLHPSNSLHSLCSIGSIRASKTCCFYSTLSAKLGFLRLGICASNRISSWWFIVWQVSHMIWCHSIRDDPHTDKPALLTYPLHFQDQFWFYKHSNRRYRLQPGYRALRCARNTSNEEVFILSEVRTEALSQWDLFVLQADPKVRYR